MLAVIASDTTKLYKVKEVFWFTWTGSPQGMYFAHLVEPETPTEGNMIPLFLLTV